MASSLLTLQGLPTELRAEIFDLVMYSSVMEVERVYRYDAGNEDEDDGDGAEERDLEHSGDEGEEATMETLESGVKITYAGRLSTALAVLPPTPSDIMGLKLACRLFNEEIPDGSWHSKVTYYFPSTVAFLDILSQWPDEKLRSLRYVHVVDTPLPLYPHDDDSVYTTAAFNDALPAFPGLQLDTLTVENIWLYADGQQLDGCWCMGAVNIAIKELLLSSGWKHLHYLSGVLGLTPSQQKQLSAMIEDHRERKGEPDFRFGYGRLVRPQYDSTTLYSPDDGDKADRTDMQEEVDNWYKQHPEEGQRDSYPDVQKLHIAMWATRGAEADYTQDGTWTAWGSVLQGLLEHVGWLKVRKNDRFLVDDGCDAPTGHL